jgi:hypothetical protein
MVYGLGFRVYDLELIIYGSWFMVYGFGFRADDVCFMVNGLGATR